MTKKWNEFSTPPDPRSSAVLLLRQAAYQTDKSLFYTKQGDHQAAARARAEAVQLIEDDLYSLKKTMWSTR